MCPLELANSWVSLMRITDIEIYSIGDNIVTQSMGRQWCIRMNMHRPNSERKIKNYVEKYHNAIVCAYTSCRATTQQKVGSDMH